ncbi:MAG: hypothetical protein Q4C74_03490 [Rothia sp. (in: high G+C Gram-positive bacteria)]|nr:hypothetical protein [Rothia sp. (in: high G+C Gram-positive bacteria)]
MDVLELEALVADFQRGNVFRVFHAVRSYSEQEWVEDCPEWKQDHAQLFSDFLQGVIPALPADVPLEKVLALCANYMAALAQLPDAPLLAARVLLEFWRKKQVHDQNSVRGFLDDLGQDRDLPALTALKEDLDI